MAKEENKKRGKQNEARAQLSREVECKFNATNEGEIALVEAYIRSNAYYVSAEKDAENGAEEKDGPVEIERVYFDTLNLSGHRAGIEIRVEHKCRSLKDDKPYKMVVKISNDNDGKTMALDRLEESYRMADSQPDLSVIDDKPVKDALKWAFGVKKLDNIDLYPMVRIMAQRAKYTYSPDGDKTVKVEFDRAVGKGHDFTGYCFDLFQCELEIKEGDPAILEEESKRLMKEFSFLSLGEDSKPTPGFKHLDAELKNKKARKFAQTHLKPDSFRVLNNIPF